MLGLKEFIPSDVASALVTYGPVIGVVAILTVGVVKKLKHLIFVAIALLFAWAYIW